MNPGDQTQELELLRMQLEDARRSVNECIDAIRVRIDALLPPLKPRRRRKRTREEYRKILAA